MGGKVFFFLNIYEKIGKCIYIYIYIYIYIFVFSVLFCLACRFGKESRMDGAWSHRLKGKSSGILFCDQLFIVYIRWGRRHRSQKHDTRQTKQRKTQPVMPDWLSSYPAVLGFIVWVQMSLNCWTKEFGLFFFYPVRIKSEIVIP